MRKHLFAVIIILTFNLNFSQSYNFNQPKEFIISGVISSLDNDELLEYATITLLNTENNDVITDLLHSSELRQKKSPPLC